MLLFPNAKINLGLHITGKRADGYHELATVFYPVLLKDMLEIIQSDKAATNHEPPSNSTIIFTTTGLTIPGEPDKNLCVKAYHLLKKDYPELPAIKMHLHKIIPMGAGLGGGSADGAFALRLINEKFQLNVSDQQLIHYAAQLGSDCPFFIVNKPCFATGRGELLEPINLDLSDYQFVLVNPNIHLSTKWAFEQLTPAKPQADLRSIVQQPIETWKNYLHNDFEAPIAKHYPEIQSIKDTLYSNGAIYASMTGSGSTVFGIFSKTATIQLSKELNYSYHIV
jgi:4-diphosphocytidyl-2-C-methyl-D-erythritol kinase